MRQYLRVVLAVTPGISCALNSKDNITLFYILRTLLHRSCQATKLVALSQSGLLTDS